MLYQPLKYERKGGEEPHKYSISKKKYRVPQVGLATLWRQPSDRDKSALPYDTSRQIILKYAI